MLKEQTIFNDDGTRSLREKKEKEDPSKVLLKPSDPEATFRRKAGGKHLGYVANLVETVGENKSLITDYAYEQNIYGDSQFMKDHLSKEPIYEQDVLMVADGAYGSELNVAEAAKHGIRLITTNFTGEKPADIFAEFIFSKDGIQTTCTFSKWSRSITITASQKISCRQNPNMWEKQTRFHFGFKIAALNFKKLLDYENSLVHYTAKKEIA